MKISATRAETWHSSFACTLHKRKQVLLHRYTLGQVARLVDIATPQDGKVIGEQLQRHSRNNWLHKTFGNGNRNHIIGNFTGPSI